MALTAVEVRVLKGRERPYKVSDSGGLYLFIQPSGQRYWRLAYRYDGKQRTMALGVYPDVGLADARSKRDAVRKILAAGSDPVAVARDEALAEKLAQKVTFRVVAEEWFSKCEREGRAEITLHKQRWLLDFAYPKLAERPIAHITAHEVYETLRTVEAKGHYETARRLRGTCGQVFRYAVATGRAERDVCADLRGSLITPKVKHLGAITKQSEVGKLMRAIDGFDGYRVTHAALRLAPDLFVRPGSMRPSEPFFTTRLRSLRPNITRSPTANCRSPFSTRHDTSGPSAPVSRRRWRAAWLSASTSSLVCVRMIRLELGAV